MKVVRRYLGREIYSATGLVLLAFLMLFALFDLINELDEIGKGDYGLPHVAAYILLTQPSRAYEIMPIAVLIGSLYALTTLARHSEITVLRTSGLSTAALIGRMSGVGAAFVVLTFVIGEFVAPPTDRIAQQLRLQAQSKVLGQEFRSGLWLKDDTSFVNIRTVMPDARLRGVRIFDFDRRHILRSISEAAEGEYLPPNSWRLSRVVRTVFDADGTRVERLDELTWNSALNPDILGVLLVAPERMSIKHLRTYIDHLEDNQQRADRYEIAFWKKLIYPMASMVMLLLAVPFALQQHRFGGVSVRVFSGIMVGILFHMLNGLFANLGIINHWPPFVSAITPSLLFLTAAAVMLWWEGLR